MARYQIITLVDITRTQPSRNESDEIKIKQQANFNSLLQAIGLRANVEWTNDPKRVDGRLPRDIGGKSVYWIWNFYTERDFLFENDQGPVGLLINDLNGVPVINNLTNSVDIDPACFISKGKNANVWIYETSEEE